MLMTEKIDLFIKTKNIKDKKAFAQLCGVPYTTLLSFYDKGYGNAKRETLYKLKTFMGITLDELSDDRIEITSDVFDKKEENFSSALDEPQNKEMINKYNLLNEIGQKKVLQYMEDLLSTNIYKKGN